jgi:acyl carrier protein
MDHFLNVKGHDMQNTYDIQARIQHFIMNTFPLARQQRLNDVDPLLQSGIVDSLGILEIVDFLEKEFHVSIVDEELLPENFESVHTLTAFVVRKGQIS